MPRQAVVAFAVGCAGLSAAASATETAPSPPPRAAITIARDTTYFLGPVKPDGTVDYAAALDAIYGKGVRPQDNAAIPLFEAFGPDPLLWGRKDYEAKRRNDLADILKRLEISSLPESGQYLREPELSLQADILKAKRSPWSQEEYPRVRAWLTANEAPLARVIEASRRPRLWFPRPKDASIGSTAPFFSELRWATGALSARAMLQLRAGNVGPAWSDVLAVHRLAALQAREGRLTSWLFAKSYEGVADEAAAAIITQGKLDGASARAKLAELAAIAVFQSSAEVVHRILRAETLDGVSRLAVEHSAEEVKILDVPALVWDEVDWNVVLRTANQWVDRLLAIARRPAGRDRRAAVLLWEEESRAADQAARNALTPEAMKGAGRTAISHAVGDFLSALFIPSRFVATDDYTHRRGDINRVALALAVYRADKGAYPLTLASLVPRFFTRLPKDPFTGAVFAYERQDAGYLLYSPGPDQKFDREHDGSGDDVALRMR